MSSPTEEVMKDWVSMLPWDHPVEIRLREALLAWETAAAVVPGISGGLARVALAIQAVDIR